MKQEHVTEGGMKNRGSSLFDPFETENVEGLEIAIRRDGGGFRLVVACRSSDGRMFEHERECSDGDCDETVTQLLNDAVAIVTGGTPRTEARQIAAPSHTSGRTSGLASKLSEREREVLRLVAEGNSNKAIAMKLGISVHTVNAHRVAVMSKLDIHDAQGLTRFAAQHGMIDVRRPR